MSTNPAPKLSRPLSPHLLIYRPQLTSIMSILHRMTGAGMAVGTAMVVWWLVAAASGEGAYNHAMAFARSPVGLFLLFGWSAAFCYHICNGVRHLIWDTVHMLKIENAYRAGYVVWICAALLLAGIWGTVIFHHSVHTSHQEANDQQN